MISPSIFFAKKGFPVMKALTALRAWARGGCLVGETRCAPSGHCSEPAAPVAYQIILEPGIGQFREFEPRRVHTRIYSLGTFSCGQIYLRKARERELATLDEQSTSSGIAEPYAR